MTTALWALVSVVVVGMLLRMPIGFSMLMAGVAYLLVKGQDLGLVAEQVSNGLYNSYVLLAVPLFVFAANIMNAGTVSERIFDFCRILVGRMRGGLAQVDILVSVIFSGMSGSAIADAAGPGLVTIKQMLKKPEYSRGFAGAVVVAAGAAIVAPLVAMPAPPGVPVSPMGVFCELCWPAPVAGLATAGLGGVDCAKAVPMAATVTRPAMRPLMETVMLTPECWFKYRQRTRRLSPRLKVCHIRNVRCAPYLL